MTARGRATVLAAATGLAAIAGWLSSGALLPALAPVLGGGSSASAGPAEGDRAVLARLLERLPTDPGRLEVAPASLASPSAHLAETVQLPDSGAQLRVEYAFDAELTERVGRVLRHARVKRGHAIVLDPRTGRVLAYVSTDPDAFPPERAYPAASLVKVVTAAAALDHDPEAARRPCRYTGNPYRLRRSQIDPPRRGREISLEGALATSNNHCFAQLAVHSLGGGPLVDAIRRFGWLDAPAPGHAAGRLDPGDDAFDLGRLGCGLAGCRITPLHAAVLAASLAEGLRVEPWWIHRIRDETIGLELPLPDPEPWRRIMRPELAAELRAMLVRTTTRGTARSAFRGRRGRPRLGPVAVAGKTGNLNGREPKGRYEWFMGVAPADDPSVAVAVVQLHDHLWWQNSAAVAAGVLEQIFCERGRCDAALARRYTGDLGREVAPVFLSDSGD